MWFPKHAGPVLGLADEGRSVSDARPVASLGCSRPNEMGLRVSAQPQFAPSTTFHEPSSSVDVPGAMFPARPGPTLNGMALSGNALVGLSGLDLEGFTLELLQALMLERYESEVRFNSGDACAFALLNRDFWASNLLRARAATPTRCKETKPPILGVDEDAPSEPDPECQKNERWIARLEHFVALWEMKLRELGCPGWV